MNEDHARAEFLDVLASSHAPVNETEADLIERLGRRRTFRADERVQIDAMIRKYKRQLGWEQ